METEKRLWNRQLYNDMLEEEFERELDAIYAEDKMWGE